MTSLASLLKAEITRLARKEVRALVEPLRKANARHRHELAALKRQLAEQQRLVAAFKSTAGKAPTPFTDTEAPSARFSAKGLKSLRAKLGLSAADFGKLVGVTGQSIYAWETGKTVPRDAPKAAISGLRSLGKREALGRLEALNVKPARAK